MTQVRAGSDPVEVADGIHGAAVRLLRHVRRADTAAGISAPQLSARAVLVINGPQTMTGLATAERVRLPTISRLVSDLEARELVIRTTDPTGRRVFRSFATRKGRVLLEETRRKRRTRLVEALSRKRNWQSLPRRRIRYFWLRCMDSVMNENMPKVLD